MKSSKFMGVAVLCSVILSSLMGCEPAAWRKVQIGKTTGAEIEDIFKTPLGIEDRYAYALSEDELTGNKTLIMMSMDDDGIAISKHYWHIEPRPMIFGLFVKDSWTMSLQTQIFPSQLREYSPVPGSREKAILEHFGRLLFDTSRHFEHINNVSGISRSMGQILAIATDQYDRRADQQILLGKKSFVFDGQSHGRKCRVTLKVVDDRRGIYSLTVKGYRTNGFNK